MKVVLLAIGTCVASAFVSQHSPSFVRQQHSALQSTLQSSVIKGEELNQTPFDIGQGGVRLAEGSPIKITGTVKHKPGKAEPSLSELLRYHRVAELEEATVMSNLEKSGARIASTGRGKELYKDPGETVVAETILAPMDAAHDAFNACGSLKDAEKVIFNFCGGDDLQLLEVLDAMTFLVKDALDVNTKAKISFNSLCHATFPLETVYLTIVAVDGTSDEEGGGAQAMEEVYFHDGKWWTTKEEDINTAVA